MSEYLSDSEFLPDPEELIENYNDEKPKLFLADFINDFYSINYLGIFKCEFPEGCNHRTINPPFCPEHMRFCDSVEIKKSSLIPGQKGLFAVKSNLSNVVPRHQTNAFYPGQRICLYGRKKGSKINPNSSNLIDQQQLIDVYGNKTVNIYGFATDDDQIYDCALIRYPGACANDIEADQTKYQIPGYTNNATINYDQDECWLEATRTIEYGEEIFVDYGSDFWKYQIQNESFVRYHNGTQIPDWFLKFYKETFFIDVMEDDLWTISETDAKN